MTTRSVRPFLNITIVLLAVNVAVWPARADAQSKPVPASVAALLPATAKLADSSWGVFDTEFGKTFSADMRATFPGRRISCDSTVGPELRAELKGDTAWETPPMLDMAVDMFNQDITRSKPSLNQRMANLKASNSDIKSVNALKEEKLANGTLVYIDYTESCATQGGTNTILQGFARRGATMFTFDLWLSADAAEATTFAKDMLARFAKLDVKALLK